MNEKTLSLKAAYAFGNSHGLQIEVTEIREMVIEWDSSYTSSLRRGYIIELFEKNGVFESFKNENWPYGNTPAGETRRKRYLKIKLQYEEFLTGKGSENGPEDDGDDLEEETDLQKLQFPLEAHLRDFLAKNMGLIEKGMKLHSSAGHDGVEYPIDGGYIDLLGVDKSGTYVVIELKLSQGRNKALGQLLYYMGWIDQHLGNGPCRGFIIANEITDQLCVAIARVPGVRLAKYQMNFAIEPVEGKASDTSHD